MGAVASAVFLLCAGPAICEPAQLTIGQGWAWVREFFPPSGKREIERIVWTNPPPQLDLGSLQVWNVLRPWPVQEWHWTAPAPSPPPTADQPLVWKPRDDQPMPPIRDQLDIRLARPLPDSMGYSLTYRLPNFNWNVLYRVIVRGIGPESIDAVQVDLSAFLQIHNGNAKAYPAARISWVGIDKTLLPPPKPFGLLSLNPDTALTDLWRTDASRPPLEPFTYPLETEVALPANGEARIQFARVRRKPAQITHICDSDEIPSPTPGGGLPLRRALLIPNTQTMGLGFPLPPGQADLFLGALRGAPVQSGHVLHTPFPGTLKIDMGRVEGVRASRQADKEILLPEGIWQADHSVTLINDLTSPVYIQVEEKPSTLRQWDLVRSSIPCRQSTRKLHFNLTVPPQSTKTLTYRLRMRTNEAP